MPVEAKAFRRRSRRGCLTCRQHRTKCDEKSPTCGNCARLERDCKWGLKASFHPSRMAELSSPESSVLSEIEVGRGRPNLLTFVDETKNIEGEYSRSSKFNYNLYPDQGISEYTDGSEPQSIRPSRSVETHVPQSALHTDDSGSRSLRHSRTTQRHDSQPPPIPSLPVYSARNNISIVHVASKGADIVIPNTSPQKVLVWPINDHVKAGLLSSYFRETSRWCEVTDSTKSFSTLWSHLVLESQSFAAAAVMLASITSLCRDSTSILLARELSTFARETLRCLQGEHHEGDLLATILLCMYCSDLGNIDEEKAALLVCANLLQKATVNCISEGVFSSCFWAFARQDIWAAYSSKRSTLILAENWKISQDNVLDAPIQDTYSNRAIHITARIINELSEDNPDKNEAALQNLWLELQTWIIERPSCVRCIMEVEAAGDSPFPTILFSNPSAVCGNIYYHVASLLLLATGKISNDTSAMVSPVCHARRIAGISITNNEHANLINHVHPLCVAARFVPTGMEKMIIAKHLGEIEDLTGWRTKRHVLNLERMWGL